MNFMLFSLQAKIQILKTFSDNCLFQTEYPMGTCYKRINGNHFCLMCSSLLMNPVATQLTMIFNTSQLLLLESRFTYLLISKEVDCLVLYC